ncbi:hypothetical protein [Candidatus Amarobacter glycogenicus]|uniref:hypothetical protein n=1 Tax=Candidatus Amarobacter glycogenicus TaxID=3140699 RepID=UPI0031CC692A
MVDALGWQYPQRALGMRRHVAEGGGQSQVTKFEDYWSATSGHVDSEFVSREGAENVGGVNVLMCEPVSMEIVDGLQEAPSDGHQPYGRVEILKFEELS